MKTITAEMRAKAKAARDDPNKTCGAPSPWSPTGKCRNWAGQGTDHVGTGYCHLHDGAPKPKATQRVDLVDLSGRYGADPEVLELAGEIAKLRELLDSKTENPDRDLDVIVRLTNAVRQLVATKNTIELQRNYLIPVSIAVNVARRVTDVIARHLPPEQRLVLRDEIADVLRVELALDRDGRWADPAAQWAKRIGP